VAEVSALPRSVTAFRLAALIGYPTLIILALWLNEPSVRALGLPLLAIALVGPWPRRWPGRSLLLASLLLALLVITMPALALWPPGLICIAVAVWFAQTLRAGKQPAIARFAALVHESQGREMPTDSNAWLRLWTGLWALLLAGLGSGALVLAQTDQAGLWLAWVLGVIPLAIFSTLALEHLLRQHRFPEHEHWSLGRFLLMLARIRPEQLAR
jgi:hypothetical protein